MSASNDLDQQLADTRRRGNLDDLAQMLAVHANMLVEQGQIGLARRELDEAADIHRQQGRVYDEARCTQFAATLCRLEGSLDEAQARAQRAAQLAKPGSPIAVSAATELGEIALARNDGRVAVDAYGRALAEGEAAGLVASARSALLRKCAIALVMVGRYQEAAHSLGAAHDLLMQAGDTTNAIRALVEQATALQAGGDVAGGMCSWNNAMQAAEAAGDHHAQADLYLLQAAQAVDQRNTEAALEAARTARKHALEAVAPLSYLAAAVAIAELSEAKGDRLAAYEALTVGWTTLGDLLGRDAAKSTFEPKLRELRERWGAVPFAEIKAAYEAQRRAGRETNKPLSE